MYSHWAQLFRAYIVVQYIVIYLLRICQFGLQGQITSKKKKYYAIMIATGFLISLFSKLSNQTHFHLQTK